LGRFHNLQQISLLKTDFESLLAMKNSTIKFSAKFGEKELNFEIEPQKNLAHKLLLNGHEGNDDFSFFLFQVRNQSFNQII